MPVARYSACKIAWGRWEQPVVAVCAVVPVGAIVPVAAIVPVFSSVVHIPALYRDHSCIGLRVARGRYFRGEEVMIFVWCCRLTDRSRGVSGWALAARCLSLVDLVHASNVLALVC